MLNILFYSSPLLLFIPLAFIIRRKLGGATGDSVTNAFISLLFAASLVNNTCIRLIYEYQYAEGYYNLLHTNKFSTNLIGAISNIPNWISILPEAMLLSCLTSVFSLIVGVFFGTVAVGENLFGNEKLITKNHRFQFLSATTLVIVLMSPLSIREAYRDMESYNVYQIENIKLSQTGINSLRAFCEGEQTAFITRGVLTCGSSYLGERFLVLGKLELTTAYREASKFSSEFVRKDELEQVSVIVAWTNTPSPLTSTFIKVRKNVSPLGDTPESVSKAIKVKLDIIDQSLSKSYDTKLNGDSWKRLKTVTTE